MTPEEWRESNDPEPMVRALPADRFQREFWRFALACAQRVRHLLPESGQAAVEAQERFVAGRASPAEVEMLLDASDLESQAYYSGGRAPDARAYAESAVGFSPSRPITTAQVLSASSCAASAWACAMAEEYDGYYDRVYEAARARELAAQAELLRSIVQLPPG